MASPVIDYPPPIAERPARGDEKAWPTLLVLGAIWALTFNQLRVEWSINPQYTYGWTVPFLAFYLFAERWKDRPRLDSFRFAPLVAALLIVFGAALAPIRLVEEAAPDWRLLSWAMAACAVAISLGALYHAGGKSWLRHFAIPILFILLAVPWPVPLEKAIVQHLMRFVARVCVEALSFFAIPAVQQGNVIVISTGRVGVEEACSGVRSLQTTLMAAVFLGELFRFTILRRGLLLAGGLAVAFLCNLGRTFSLVWISVQESPAKAMEYHDRIGLAVLVVSLGFLAAICALLRPRGASEITEISAAERPSRAPRFARRSVLIAAGCWLLAIELGTEVWYRLHERGPAGPTWTVNWPTNEPDYRILPLDETTRAVLRCDEGQLVAWRQPDGVQWSMNFLRWLPGRASKQLARSHGPEVCLAANGAVLKTDFGVQPMRAAGIELPMHRYLFMVGGAPMYVFFCLWEDHAAADGPESTRRSMKAASRMRDVLEGRRNTGQQVIELAVLGAPSAADATAATERLLQKIVRP